MPEVNISIIIVSWNALPHLKTYLPSVWEHSHKDAEIILADNASTDGSAAWVSEQFPEIRIVTLEKNFGYCGGNNRAAIHARGKYLLFLNNDVEVTPGWLPPLAEMLDGDPRIAAVQPKLRSYTDPAFFEYAGAAGGFLDRFGYPLCRGRIFFTVEKDAGQYDDACDISWASGAALCIRSDRFREIGGFDESFEFHMEEIDLCWQLWNRGNRVRYCPESTVFHLGGGSLPTDSPRKTYYNFRNSLKMLYKNSTPGNLWPRLLSRLALDYIAIIRALLTIRLREAGAIMRAQFYFLRSLPGLRKKRKDLSLHRVTPSDIPVLQPYTVLWHYFIRKNKTFNQLPNTGI